MAKRGRKRKVDLEDKAACEWEKDRILSESLRDEMESMWEIPQIYHFLQLTKEALNITHLSMYEVERMFLMPKASKQLAHIMTCLLSSPSIMKSKQQKVPPMPYEFWTNILMHKLKSWFNIYHMKQQDVVKVFDVCGIETEFWNIFPSYSDIEGKDFQDFSLKQRAWLLKTVCDTVMHSRKSIQEEIAKQPWESQFETVLGVDRHGARYIYFPQFLFNDLRVYRHCLDNKVLSSVKRPVQHFKTEEEPKLIIKEEPKYLSRVKRRYKRRRSRWSSGSLPSKKFIKRKQFEFNLEQIDTNSNSVDAPSSRSSSKTSEVSVDGEKLGKDIAEENTCDQEEVKEDTNEKEAEVTPTPTPTPTQISDEEATSESQKSENDDKNINKSTLNATEVVSKEDSSIHSNTIVQNVQYEEESTLREEVVADEACVEKQVTNGAEMTEKRILEDNNSDSSVARRSERIKIKLEIEDAENLADVCESEQLSSVELRDSICRTSSPENDSEPLCDYFNEDVWPVKSFDEIIHDLSESNFQLVAESFESLKELIQFITYDKTVPGIEIEDANYLRPPCEEKLLERMNVLFVSLENVETILKESTKKARNKLQREWSAFENGVVDEDAVATTENAWIDGNSQGWQLVAPPWQDRAILSRASISRTCSQDATNETQADDTSANTTETRLESEETEKQSVKDEETEKGTIDQNEVKDEKEENGEPRCTDKNEKTEGESTTRVLRTRGISSYTALFDEESSEEDKLAEWTDIEAIYAACGPSTDEVTPDAAAKNNDSDIEDEETEDSDQDWILPSSRKRTRKRSSTGRRFKNFNHKVQQMRVDPIVKPLKQDPSNSADADGQLQVSKPVKRIPPLKVVLPKPQVEDIDTNKPIVPESKGELHTELDIKEEESPAFNSTLNQQNYVVVSTGQQQPAANYYVMPQNQSMLVPNNQFIQPTFISQVVQQPQVPQIQQIHSLGPNGQLYVYQAAPNNNIVSAAPNIISAPPPSQPAYMGPRVVYQPHAQLVTQTQTQAQPRFLQFVATPSLQQNHHRQQNYIQARQFTPQQPRIVNSTTLRPQPQLRYQRPNVPLMAGPVPRPAFPHPNGAVIRSMPLGQNVLRPGQRVPQQRGIVPNRRLNNAPRMPLVQNTNSPTRTSTNQTSSLIVLSDSDDEIEMIVQEKKKIVKKPTKSSITTAPPLLAPKPKSSIPVELLQRVNEGGISISPVKPIQPAPSTSPSTQLVVVVNETGSHYALALPNGSKLVLTPDQVAQIRASNGGKLVL